MPDLALDLRYLKNAMVVAEQGSFRRAAVLLNLSQSTVSRRVQLLERRLGVVLFERNRVGARPTLVGERFMREAAIGADHLSQAITGIAEGRTGGEGSIRVGVTTSFAHGGLSELLDVFHCRHPRVDLRLKEATAQANAAAVANGRLDAAFVIGVPQQPGCQTRHLWSERIFVALPKGHRLYESGAIGWDDIREEVFLVTADASGPEIADFIIRQLSDLGFRPRIVVQNVGRENLINLVAKGFGITLTSYATLGASYANVLFVPIGGTTDLVSSSIMWLASNPNPALKRLLEVADQIAKGRVSVERLSSRQCRKRD